VEKGYSRYETKWGESEFFDKEMQQAQNHAELIKLGVWSKE